MPLPSKLLKRLEEELASREWLEDGELTVQSLARWCQEVVGGRFADPVDFGSLEELVEYMRVELRIVHEQSASLRSSCALEGNAGGGDPELEVREAAEHLAGVAPRAAKTVFSWLCANNWWVPNEGLIRGSDRHGRGCVRGLRARDGPRGVRRPDRGDCDFITH